jgi:hypothetical protein
VFLWDWIKGIGGSRSDEAAEREEFGGEDPGETEVEHIAAAGPLTDGLAGTDAADVAEADLQEFEPPRDPAP